MDLKLDFKDVLIVPRETKLRSRKDVILQRNFKFKNGEQLNVVPVVAANMDTVGTISVFKALHLHGLFTCLHKFITLEEFQENRNLLNFNQDFYAVSIGFNEKEIQRLEKINEIVNFKTICIDVANGYMTDFVDFCRTVRDRFPKKIIIAGNVVTPEMCRRLILDGGVDIVKGGIGGGSACTTRIKTGVGYPQLSCTIDCHKTCQDCGGYFMSDGGITCPGDLGKAFGAGADFVMIGGQFGGHLENPGSVIEENGKKFKLFYGMSSSHAMQKNYNQINNYRTSEGRCIKIPYKGEISDTVQDFLGGLRSLCTYVDCEKLENLASQVNFVRVNSQYNTSLL